jgi:pSer/pThr/pTyr-binding forkhead associated (FHA) protein
VARLISEAGGGRRETRISGPVIIGRSPSATIPIDDKTLSREHTQVYGQNGRYYVKDLESKNGTYLNGQLIRQAEPLKHGDRIKVGPATFVVAFDPQDQPVAAPPAPPPPTPARRPATHVREHAPAGSGSAGRAFATMIALAVFVVGTWFAKQLILQFNLLDLMPR